MRLLQITDPPEVTGNGPDTKTVDRYLKLMDESGKVQKLSIPVSLTTSAGAAQDLIVYIKPDQEISDALVTKVSCQCYLQLLSCIAYTSCHRQQHCSSALHLMLPASRFWELL